MRDFSQMNGCEQPPTGRKPCLPLARGLRGLWIFTIAGMMTLPAFSQTLRLGPMDILLTGSVELSYDSNVDGVYPEEEDPILQAGDFFWVPGLKLQTQQVPFFRNSTFGLSGGISYQDYLKRSDLDTELYNISLDFNTVLPRLTLGGGVSSEYSVDSSKDQYVPGGVTRDPKLTQSANALITWIWSKLRLEASGNYIMERHDYVEYQIGDNDETDVVLAAYLDIFTWGSLFYAWENDVTTYTKTDAETDETTKNIGFQGAIPLTWLAHPKISYSLGIESKDDTTDEEKNGTWEPSHKIRAEDDLQLAKTLTLAGYIQWENKVYDDDVGFTYGLRLEQLLGARARHALIFTQEPRSTLGSTTDTETTTYTYDFSISDLFIYNLSMGFGATYDESTPLAGDGITEDTTTLNFRLVHNRQINRQLSRILSYKYSNERSNFHKDGPKEEHLLTYGFSYNF